MKLFYILVVLFGLSLNGCQTARFKRESVYKVSVIHDLIKSKQWSCVDVVEYFLRRSYAYNPLVRALISYNPNAIADAIRLDEKYAKTQRFVGRLHCIPILVKDNIDVRSMPSTAGCKALRYSIPNKDALVIKRLRAEGAIFITKANLAELAIGFYNSGTGGACHNPWDLTRSCGASSSGSGAGMASEMAVIALGTDTGGSIIEPATYNGVFGFRPPYNASSLDGIVPGISKQDTVGPLTKSVHELVLTHTIMTDNKQLYNSFQTKKSASLKGTRLGYIKALQQTYLSAQFNYSVDPEVKRAVDQAFKRLQRLNVELVEIEIDQNDFLTIGYLAFMGSMKNNECGAVCKKFSFDKYLGDKERFQDDAPYRQFEPLFNSPLMPKLFVDSFGKLDLGGADNCDTFPQCQEYLNIRGQLTKMVESWMTKYNLNGITFPSIVNLAFKLNPDYEFPGEVSPTFFAPFTGFSSLSIPIAFSKRQDNAPSGIPMGLNILAPAEHVLSSFLVAHNYEQAYLKLNMRLLPKSTPLL